jgi:hypothetical protein
VSRHAANLDRLQFVHIFMLERRRHPVDFRGCQTRRRPGERIYLRAIGELMQRLR